MGEASASRHCSYNLTDPPTQATEKRGDALGGTAGVSALGRGRGRPLPRDLRPAPPTWLKVPGAGCTALPGFAATKPGTEEPQGHPIV